jgi:hypothetical protein
MSVDSPGPSATLPVIELWQEPSRLWRWRYLEPSRDGQPLVFRSNKEYESREAALHSATTAYPEVAVLQHPAVEAAHGRRGRLVVLALLVLAVLVLWPRRRRRPRRPDRR